ncbi:Hypothetical predicted protein [Marmota monax]|uniref:Uncharacterized protein n=1 Tax=Marmota monax TaxID=9995 RepID=A0A5E4BJ68_MARMO|nr:hypothetical protein GHT09_015779 [Marmota monax]VTJ69465.1 Hypothetical predicted protein [Marmota monax]
MPGWAVEPGVFQAAAAGVGEAGREPASWAVGPVGLPGPPHLPRRGGCGSAAPSLASSQVGSKVQLGSWAVPEPGRPEVFSCRPQAPLWPRRPPSTCGPGCPSAGPSRAPPSPCADRRQYPRGLGQGALCRPALARARLPAQFWGQQWQLPWQVDHRTGLSMAPSSWATVTQCALLLRVSMKSGQPLRLPVPRQLKPRAL